MLVIPAERLRQAECKFKDSLGYVGRPVSKKIFAFNVYL
jgi:hypothetical protein